jgi:hypothetical protein
VFIMSPWAIFSIEFDFFSSIVVKLILSMMLENQFISLFMIIFSRARSFRNLMFSLLTDSQLLCIITKVAMFLVSTRSIFCIELYFFSAVVEEFICSVMFIYLSVSLLMPIISWSRCNFNLMITLLSDCHVF